MTNHFRFDQLTIYDGPSVESLIFAGPLCGEPTVDLFVPTTSNEAFVEFTSDGSVTKRGFSLSYSGIEPTTSTCGGILTEASGTIVSPNYDDLYPNNADCSWTIRLPQFWFIELQFEDFSIEAEQNCR